MAFQIGTKTVKGIECGGWRSVVRGRALRGGGGGLRLRPCHTENLLTLHLLKAPFPEGGCLPSARLVRYFFDFCINYPDFNPGFTLP